MGRPFCDACATQARPFGVRLGQLDSEIEVDRLLVDAVDPLDANAALIDEYLVSTSR
ncbi:hypothetical protein [Glycomyces rhizosphaerae]|uniref:Uncharacterized protein n=1 Tax=Glycomyces rhizosphaerae TaxID=2054422 RepID=A0ABV7PVT7_9ACTN